MLCELRACWSNEKVENEAVALLLSRNVPYDLSRTLQAKGRTDDCLPARVTNTDVQIPSRGQTRAKPTPQPRNMRICLPAIPSIFSSRRPGHSLPFLDSILFSPNIPVITCWQASGHHDIAIVKLKNNLSRAELQPRKHNTKLIAAKMSGGWNTSLSRIFFSISPSY
jgi:hypothetical protein